VIKRKSEPYLYLIPALTIVILFVYYPFVKTIISSFFKVDIYGNLKEFVAFNNYLKLFSNQNFYRAFSQTLLHTLMYVPISIFIGLGLAFVSNQKSHFSRVYETLFTLSMAISVSIACQIFRMIYNPSYGLLAKTFGINIAWLTNKQYALFAVTFILIWIQIGFNYIYLSASLKNIPEDIIESANIDGAGFFRKLFHIYIPMISSSLFYLIVTSIITGLTMITPVLILTEGGPQRSTQTMIYNMYVYAYNNSNYAMAYTYGVVVFFLVAIIVAINFSFERKSVFYR
jgi:sn-glycerol 3-phosphate transport system permease protein